MVTSETRNADFRESDISCFHTGRLTEGASKKFDLWPSLDGQRSFVQAQDMLKYYSSVDIDQREAHNALN
jgi:hypothetical protein